MRALISSVSSFLLSVEAVQLARTLGAKWAENEHCPLPPYRGMEGVFLPTEVPRHDPILLQVFEQMGPEKMTVEDYRISCVEIPDDVRYYVSSYCGEWIDEIHRVWNATSPNGEPSQYEAATFTIDSVFEP